MGKKKKTQDINEGKALIFVDDKGGFTLSPRGCFASALIDTSIAGGDDILELNEDQKFEMAFSILVERFKKNGWIRQEGKPEGGGTSEEQREKFGDTILGFYKNATRQQLDAAFDEFFYLLKKHGNTV